MSRELKRFFLRWEWALAGAIVLELIVFGALNSDFLNLPRLLGSLTPFMPIAIIALFVTFVLVTVGIDIQAGAIVGLTSILIGVLWQDSGLNIFAACLISLAISALCGGFSGFFVAYTGAQSTVITFGGSFLFGGLALAISTISANGAQGIKDFPAAFRALGSTTLTGGIPILFLIFFALVIIAWFLLHKSQYGRKVYLCGQNSKAAEFSGINTRFIVMSTYVLSGLSAGIAGILLTSFLGTAQADLGSDYTLPIIAVVVLGGTRNLGGQGSIIGTALAAIFIGLLRIGLSMNGVAMQNLNIFIAILLLGIVAFRVAGKNTELQRGFKTNNDSKELASQA